MNREKALDILRLLSNLESVVDIKDFRDKVPDWLIQKIDDEVEWLNNYIKENKNDTRTN